MTRRLALLLAAVALALGGCSLLSFAYGRADTLAALYVDRWLDLDQEQTRRFKARVRERMAEHRRDELPRYAAFLGRAIALVEGVPDRAAVDGLIDEGRDLFELGLRRSLPLIGETLAGLKPAQVEHLAAELAENNAEYLEDEIEVDADDRQRERRRDLVREVERWTGRLEPAQRATLERLVDRVPDGARAWYEHRLVRQQGLLALLRRGAGPDEHARFVQEWWLGDRHLRPDHAAQLERDRAATVDALVELARTLTPRQRERAASRLRAIVADIEALHAAGHRADAPR